MTDGFAALTAPPEVAAGADPTGTLTALDKLPPATGLNPIAVARPEAERSAVVSAMLSLPFARVVGRSEPFQRTTEVAAKFAPESVTVTGPAPPATLAGLTESICGACDAPGRGTPRSHMLRP